jgi:hypothetical protein
MSESDHCECCGAFLLLEGVTVCPKCNKESDE